MPRLQLILFLFLISSNLSAQSLLYTIPDQAFENYKNSYNYTCWNDNFLTGGILARKFVNQTSSYNLNINFTDLSIHSLNLTTTNHSQTSAFVEDNSVTFANLYAGDIRYGILQNGAVAYEKTTAPTNTGIADSQMAEYGTWQNRRFVSTNFTNAAPIDEYFTGVEFTNWHSRFRMTFHVRPTADINNGQLQFTVDIPSAYSNYFTQGNMGAISAAFELQTPNLPIELIDFTATAINNKLVRLKWRTLSELNNKGFDIERSVDGRIWETIAFIPGVGTSLEVNNYSYDDLAPLRGLNYYRLKQMDFDGSFQYSVINVVNISQTEQFIVYPSPTKGETVYVGFSRRMKGTLFLYDLQGRLLYQVVLEVEQEQFKIDLPKGIPSGVYFVEFVNEKTKLVQKLLIE